MSVSSSSAISDDGRYVAFDSYASNLVPDDTNAAHDVFVHDRNTATTTRVSVASDGTQADLGSSAPAISADGRYVTFSSMASNLVPDDTNAAHDVFVHDRNTATTTRVSVASDGTQADGTQADSGRPKISADGRYVTFSSMASNLVPDDTNAGLDVFVHDRNTATTTRVSVASDGAQAVGPPPGSEDLEYMSDFPAISADGRYITFLSLATNLVPDDTNAAHDVFVHDRNTATTTRVSVASDGTEADLGASFAPTISAEGRYVTFSSMASNLVPDDTNARLDVFVHDRNTATTTRVSVASDGTQANDTSVPSGISATGRYITFVSDASNLVPDDTNTTHDAFVHDRNTATTTRVSVASDGTQANLGTVWAAINADGRYVVLTSDASNLVTGDSNSEMDVFVRDRGM